MPLYEYEHLEPGCPSGKERFTVRRPVGKADLTRCPLCKKPVRRVYSSFFTPKVIKPVSISDAKQAGFKVYKRIGKGEYELM